MSHNDTLFEIRISYCAEYSSYDREEGGKKNQKKIGLTSERVTSKKINSRHSSERVMSHGARLCNADFFFLCIKVQRPRESARAREKESERRERKGKRERKAREKGKERARGRE